MNVPGMRFCGQCGARLAVPLDCPVCSFLNAAGMRFCGQCGSALFVGAAAAPARIDPAAATGGGSVAEPAGVTGLARLVPTIDERKVVTILFGDISGFTTMAERLDPEEVKHVMDLTLRSLAAEVERYEGHVDKFLGDNIMALFGAPRAHEDDPERAVRCAIEMQHAMRRLSADLERTRGLDLQLHIGINTGEVLAGRMAAGRDIDYTVMGDPVNLAARLQHTAGPGEIVVGEATYRASNAMIEYRSRGHVQVRGKEQPVSAWEVVNVRTRRGEERRLTGRESRLVGRDAEFAQLKHLYGQVVRDRRLHHVLLLGPAGIGKSRLLWELEKYLSGLPQAPAFRKGRAQPYGPGAGFRALGEMIKAQCGILDDDPRPVAAEKLLAGVQAVVERAGSRDLPGGDPADPIGRLVRRAVAGASEAEAVAHWLGIMLGLRAVDVEPDTVRTEIFWSLRCFFARQAEAAPLVLAVEDLQWADQSMLEFIEYLRETLPDHPILIVTLARPALWESGTGQAWIARSRAAPAFTQLVVGPLSEDHSRRLVRELLADADLPAAFLDLVMAKTEGNPFFLEEIIRMLIDAQVIVQRDGQWKLVAAVETLHIPDTVQALVGARVDDLPEGEKRLLQGASVVGRVFWAGALGEMFPQVPPAGIAESLRFLERREFIVERAGPAFAGEREYSFRNLLTRDVTYISVPKALRGEEHARVAAWIEAKAGDRVDEFCDLLAYHYEKALLLGLDMMTLGETAAAGLLDRAIHFLKTAGETAMARQALSEANGYFSRVIELLALCGREPADPAPGAAAAVHPEYLDVLCGHAEVQEGLGNYDLALLELGHVIGYAEADGAQATLARALLARANIYYTRGALDRLEADAGAALALFSALRDQRGKAATRLLLGQMWTARDNLEAAEKEMIRAMQLAAEVEDRLGEARAMRTLAHVLRNRDDMAGARRYTDAALAAFRRLGNRREAAYCLSSLATILSYAPDLREHQRFAQEALGLFQELDDRRGEALLLLTMAYAAADRRQTTQAEEHGRRALALFRRQGDRRSEAWALRGIALALAPAGRTPEAGILYSQALDNALSMGDNGILPELYRGHAEVLLALDQAPAALAAAEKGVASVAPDDGYSLTTTYRALGLARLACGDCPGALAALQQSLSAAKPDTYPLEYARSCWAQAALLDHAGRLADAGRQRADALAVVESLVWSESPIPPPEDLLTLARHEARQVP
jgi:class 3 adenylate cyclase/tetratricopeptide (TPR) repeat protein